MTNVTNRRAVLGVVLAGAAIGTTSLSVAAIAPAPKLSAVDRRVLDLWARRAKLRLISRRTSDAAMAAKDAGNEAEFHRLLDRENDVVTTMIAVEDEIEEHIGTSLLALGAAILIEMRPSYPDIEADIYSASLTVIRPQLTGAIAEDADRVLAQYAEACT